MADQFGAKNIHIYFLNFTTQFATANYSGEQTILEQVRYTT